MSDTTRSERACPVCGRHTLAIDEPPHIDVMGVQAYSDMLGMGDFQQPSMPGIVCLGCGTRWPDLEAFDRNEPVPPDQVAEAPLDEPAEDAWDEDFDPLDGDRDQPGAAANR